MRRPSEDVFVADLAAGAVLVLHPERGAQMFTETQRAVRWLLRGGWDYFSTHHHSDTGDEVEQWIPLHDPRFDGRER